MSKVIDLVGGGALDGTIRAIPEGLSSLEIPVATNWLPSTFADSDDVTPVVLSRLIYRPILSLFGLPSLTDEGIERWRTHD